MIGLYILDTYCTEYAKLKISRDLVFWDEPCMEFRWVNVDARKWLYYNAKNIWELKRESPDYYIVFADGKDAIMFKMLWL